MSEIDRFRPDDRRGVETLYRRTHGPDAAEAHRLRWEWQHRRNPNNRTGEPGIWVAREGPTVVGQYPTLPVRISLRALEVDGAWGTGARVAPEHRCGTYARHRGRGALDARAPALAAVSCAAVRREAADAARSTPAPLANGAQSRRVRAHSSCNPDRRQVSAASRRM